MQQYQQEMNTTMWKMLPYEWGCLVLYYLPLIVGAIALTWWIVSTMRGIHDELREFRIAVKYKDVGDGHPPGKSDSNPFSH